MNNWKAALPVIADRQVRIEEFGGVCDGKTSNTAAFAAAVAALVQQGGGHLVVSAGIWLTGPIELKSGIDLHLEAGAVILFDKKKEEYPLYIADYEGMRCIRAKSPLSAEGAKDISITGSGVIDGNGHLWRLAKQFKFTAKEWAARKKTSPDTYTVSKEGEVWFPSKSAFEGALRKEPDLNEIGEEAALAEAAPYWDFYRPCMVNLVHCERVLLEGVTFMNSPAWNVHPLFCQDVTIRHAWIKNDAFAQNGDGLDAESCKRVEVLDTVFDVGDDAICLKSGKNAEARKIQVPTEQVRIKDCKVIHGHGGFVIGSEMSRGVRDVDVENCTFIGTDVGLRFKTALGRGGVVEDIRVNGIQMVRIPGEAIIFTAGYVLTQLQGASGGEGIMTSPQDIPEFKNIHIKNVVALETKTGLKIAGLQEMPVHDITLEQVELHCDEAASIVNAERIAMKQVCFIKNGSGERIEIADEADVKGKLVFSEGV